ncbi:hypothetical protein ABIF79_008847 [Bradyrhizobium japonicum]
MPRLMRRMVSSFWSPSRSPSSLASASTVAAGALSKTFFGLRRAGTGGFRPLSEGFGQRDSSRIGRSEPHRPEILLIHHSLKP